jgi:hypothetical protein
MNDVLRITANYDIEYSTGKIESFSAEVDYVAITETSTPIKIHDKEYKPKIGDKLYFLPGVNIPRVKLKDLMVTYNISSVRNINDANVVFGGKNTNGKLVDSSWEYSLQTVDFKECIEALKPSIDSYYYDKLATALEFYTKEFVVMSWHTYRFFINDGLWDYKNYVQNPGAVAKAGGHNGYFNIVDSCHKDMLATAMAIEVISEASLISQLNGDDAVTINYEVFEKLSDMFKSSDADNYVLAMEIMANSNYAESLLYLEILFKEYGSVMQQNPTKNHVNFKSLLSYLNKSRYNFDSNINTIVQSLIDKQLLTIESLKILMERYSSEIESSGNKEFFKVKSITLTEELMEQLNTNFVYEVRKDYIPIEIEESIVLPPEEEEKELTWL